MESIMSEQDKRAVESMCRCGLGLEGVVAVFPKFPKEDIIAVYQSAKGIDAVDNGEPVISMNCS